MNDALSPFMEKENIKRKRNRKGIGILIVFFVLSIVAAGVYVFLDSDGLAYAMENGFLAQGQTPEPTAPAAAIQTLVPTDFAASLIDAKESITAAASASLTPAPTPYLTPEPYVHPGVRDDMFTDGEVIKDDMSYHSGNLSIEIEVVKVGESVAYVAEVYFRTLDNFLPVFAGGKFHGGYATVSELAEEHNAVFAVNSDSCTATEYGVIIRNGEILRDIVAADHLAIFGDGSMQSFYPRNISGEYFIKKEAVHVFNFGPMLLNNGKAVTKFMYSHIRSEHPRTAIGMIEPYHYYFVVVDGRSDYSEGMTLEELSAFMVSLGCVDAYNLDGGGSSTMVFDGRLINLPLGETEERELDGAILFVEE